MTGANDEQWDPQSSVSRASCPQILVDDPGGRFDARSWKCERRSRDRPAAMPASRADRAAGPGNGREQRGTTRATTLPTPADHRSTPLATDVDATYRGPSPLSSGGLRRGERGGRSGRRHGTQQVENTARRQRSGPFPFRSMSFPRRRASVRARSSDPSRLQVLGPASRRFLAHEFGSPIGHLASTAGHGSTTGNDPRPLSTHTPWARRNASASRTHQGEEYERGARPTVGCARGR